MSTTRREVPVTSIYAKAVFTGNVSGDVTTITSVFLFLFLPFDALCCRFFHLLRFSPFHAHPVLCGYEIKVSAVTVTSIYAKAVFTGNVSGDVTTITSVTFTQNEDDWLLGVCYDGI